MKPAPQVILLGMRGTSLKVECRVYQSQREMLVAARSFGPGVGNDTAALCEGDPALMPRGRVAIVFFCRTHLTKGVVAHEMTHASLCLMARRGKKRLDIHVSENSDAEEGHADTVGNLVDEFHKKYGV